MTWGMAQAVWLNQKQYIIIKAMTHGMGLHLVYIISVTFINNGEISNWFFLVFYTLTLSAARD